ncbi:MAG: IS1182 family transposase [Gammaproteobacteria bacterium]
MAKTFRPYEPNQLLLLPPALADWVPEHHLARFVSEVVGTLDLSAIEDTYEEDRGAPPYHPCMLVTVLLYAYATGVYSSRRIAAHLDDSVAFQFLAAGNRPDFRTISDFRRRHGAALTTLFTQVLRLCQKAGLVKLGRVAVDGTKLKANASKHKAMSYGRMKTTAAALEREVQELLQRAAQVDADEDRRYGKDTRGDELPAELAHREARLQKIREAMAALQAEAQEQARAEGKDPHGVEPKNTAQRNFTDPESRIQKQGRTYLQGYNAQVAVDAHAQVIVAHHVTAVAPDVQQLVPLVQRIPQRLRRKPKQVLADAGYWSEANVKDLERRGIEPFIAPHRRKHTDPVPPAPRGRPPAGLSAKERMGRKLLTLRGRATYAWRQILPEPVFGQIKHARGFRQFLRRGLARVQEDWAMICTVHNLLKLYRATA